MSFYGQNYFKDLLHYSDDHTLNDNAAIQQNYQLQRRLTDFFANNDKVQLLKSQKYSGEVNLLGDKSPLGGPIDWNLNGIRNVPNLNDHGCTSEFPFWSFNNKEGNNQPLNPINKNNVQKPLEQKKLVEKFRDNKENFTDNKENFTVFDQKENFDTKNNLWWIILIIVVPILIFIVIYYLSKPSQPEYLMSYY